MNRVCQSCSMMMGEEEYEIINRMSEKLKASLLRWALITKTN